MEGNEGGLGGEGSGCLQCVCEVGAGVGIAFAWLGMTGGATATMIGCRVGKWNPRATVTGYFLPFLVQEEEATRRLCCYLSSEPADRRNDCDSLRSRGEILVWERWKGPGALLP